MLPLVGSSSSRPGSSFAARLGCLHHRLGDPILDRPARVLAPQAYRRTDGDGWSRFSSTSGVFPTRSRGAGPGAARGGEGTGRTAPEATRQRVRGARRSHVKQGRVAGQGRKGAAGHGREENDGGVVGNGCLEAVLRADVLTTDVDVHESGDVAVLEDAAPRRGKRSPTSSSTSRTVEPCAATSRSPSASGRRVGGIGTVVIARRRTRRSRCTR